MSEETNTPSQNVVVARPHRLVVQSPVAIMDTARFEHLGRVATVMAKAQILPDTITSGMDFDTIQARAFLIAGWADRMNMDPVMVGQGCSFVHGRIMFEGKVVDAAIQGTLGYEFEGEYGAWDGKINGFVEGPPGEGKLLAIRVTAVDENGVTICDSKGRPKAVEGYVGGWETTKSGSPWSSPASWRRMLRNRGVREWARFYRSGVILGTYTPEDRWESDDAIESAPKSRKLDLGAKLAGNQEGGEGFDRAGIEATINGASGHDEDGVVIEAEIEPAKVSPPKARDEINGPAPAGVIYMLAGDPVSDAGRVPTYKDGEKHSNAGEKGAAQLARYTMHPTKPGDVVDRADDAEVETADDEFPGDKPIPATATVAEAMAGLADDEDGEWHPLEQCPGPAPRGAEYTLAGEEIGSDDCAQSYIDGEPFQRVNFDEFAKLPEYEAHPEPLAEEVEEDLPEWQSAILADLRTATEFGTIQQKLPGIYNGDDFKKLDYDDKAAFRRAMYAVAVGLKSPPSHTDSPSFFRLWADTQAAGAEGSKAVNSAFLKLKGSLTFGRMPAASQESLTQTVALIVKRLAEG